jgi:hypothetical protein
MRVALGSLAGGIVLPYDYPFSRASFTLASGRMVNDPATDQATDADCLPYICGVDGPDPVKQWCAFWGRSGARAGCVDPNCADWRDMIPYCSLPQVPSAPAPVIPALTPENIVQPLPDITTVLQAQPVQPDCSGWDKLNGAIGANPGVAIAVLAGFALAVFVHHKKGRRRA